MKALVVFESMFGNTRDIAQAIADGLSTGIASEVIEVGDAPPTMPADVTLVVAGGPTHAFGLTRSSTREDAGRRAHGEIVSQGIGLREWLDGVALPHGLPAAVFDTRVAKPRVPGSAAKAAAKRLRRLRAHLVVPAESFYVEDMMGPLVDGEVERARAWGASLASSATNRPVAEAVTA